MDLKAAQAAVRATLMVMERLARRTRSPADDLVSQMLRANEARLVDAVATLLTAADSPPTDDQVTEALRRVGIHA
jgi:hypothetical protein